MPRIAVGLEYDGSNYCGWQQQLQGASVQGAVQQALSAVAGEPVQCVCAGRTDAGVHALAQVLHFDTQALRTPRSWRLGANSNLPASVSVAWASEVPAHFHARFSAQARSYCYWIWNRPTRSALLARRASWIHRPLDADVMHAAGQVLVGEHDFSAFRAVECQAKSPLRRIERLLVRRLGDSLLLEVTANAFLHHMVRNIAGLLICVGTGESSAARVAEMLAGRDRRLNAPTAPPDGLYLAAVRYPAEFGLPNSSEDSHYEATQRSAMIPIPPLLAVPLRH
jgi:tRNA pseudouridine38-40 synthase